MIVVKIYREVFGCSANTADYEIASGLLKQAGFKFVDNPNQSDLNVIFSCVVKTPTSDRMVHRIKELTKSDKPLIVAGCMPKTEKKIIEKINPRASMLGPDSIQRVVDVVNATLQGKKTVSLQDLRSPKIPLPRIRKNPFVSIIPIAIGCSSSCNYCCVKFARGKLFSYPVEKIIEEVRVAVNDGCKEIWITSQDNGCYGKDIGSSLAELLKAVCAIEGQFSVRVGMMNPTHVKPILNGLIEVYKNDKIKKFLHLPVQSGSDRILRLMKRSYTVKDFVEIVEKFRAAIPDIYLFTDIIVGFPTETEEDFQATVDLVKQVKPNKVNISKFGARPGTEAAKMKQLDMKIISVRSKQLREVVKKEINKYNITFS